MKDGIRQRLDDLEELLHEEYITGEEYATARENLLLDMGFDIVPRLEGAARREPQAVMPVRKRQGTGCGCLLALLLLLIVAAAGVLLALPEETLRRFPWTELRRPGSEGASASSWGLGRRTGRPTRTGWLRSS